MWETIQWQFMKWFMTASQWMRGGELDRFLIFPTLGVKTTTEYTETKERQWSWQQQHSLGALLTLPSWHRGKRASACGQWDRMHRDAKIPPACQVKRSGKETKKKNQTEYVNKVGLTEARLKSLFVWKMVDVWLTVAFLEQSVLCVPSTRQINKKGLCSWNH